MLCKIVAAHQFAHHETGHQRHPETAALLRRGGAGRGAGCRALRTLTFAECRHALFTGGVFGRGSFRFFPGVVIGGGALVLHGRIGTGAVVRVLVERYGFVGFLATGENKDGADSQRDRRDTVIPALAKTRVVDV